jgi:hypothetical protein
LNNTPNPNANPVPKIVRGSGTGSRSDAVEFEASVELKFSVGMKASVKLDVSVKLNALVVSDSCDKLSVVAELDVASVELKVSLELDATSVELEVSLELAATSVELMGSLELNVASVELRTTISLDSPIALDSEVEGEEDPSSCVTSPVIESDDGFLEVESEYTFSFIGL